MQQNDSLADSSGELMVACRDDGKLTPAECGSSWNVSHHCRTQGFSHDGGRHWENFTAVPDLPDTPVKGGVTRWAAKNALLFSNPDVTMDPAFPSSKVHGAERSFLTIFGSTDNGKSRPRRDCHSAAPPSALSGVLIGIKNGGVSKMAVSPTARQELAVQKAGVAVSMPQLQRCERPAGRPCRRANLHLQRCSQLAMRNDESAAPSPPPPAPLPPLSRTYT